MKFVNRSELQCPVSNPPPGIYLTEWDHLPCILVVQKQEREDHIVIPVSGDPFTKVYDQGNRNFRGPMKPIEIIKIDFKEI